MSSPYLDEALKWVGRLHDGPDVVRLAQEIAQDRPEHLLQRGVGLDGMVRDFSGVDFCPGSRCAADEQCNVRIWGGIHFRNSLDVGTDMGRKIADYMVEHSLKPHSKRSLLAEVTE